MAKPLALVLLICLLAVPMALGEDPCPAPSGASSCHLQPEPEALALEALVEQGTALLAGPEGDLRGLAHRVVEQGWSEPHPELGAWVDSQAELITFLRARVGASEDLSPSDCESSDGYLADLRTSRELAHVLVLAGRKLAYERRDNEALELYTTALRFAHRHISEPDGVLITTLVGWGLQAEAIRPIQDLVHRSNTLERNWRQALDEMGQLRANWRALPESLVSDQVAMADQLRLAAESGEIQVDDMAAMTEQYEQISGHYAGIFADAWAAHDATPFDEAVSELEEELSSVGSMLGALLSDERELELTVKLTVRMALSQFGSLIDLDMTKRLELDMLRTAIAVRLWYVEQGHTVPESLDELVPEYIDAIPVDLFAAEEPIQLARHEHHWWLYSIGPDREDQGGFPAYSAAAPERGGDLLSVPEDSGEQH